MVIKKGGAGGGRIGFWKPLPPTLILPAPCYVESNVLLQMEICLFPLTPIQWGNAEDVSLTSLLRFYEA